jgi:hypothetical protein
VSELLKVGHPLVLMQKEDLIILLSGYQKVDGGINYLHFLFYPYENNSGSPFSLSTDFPYQFNINM